jgi:F-box/leucine-rich repeat protein 2/20
MEIFRRLDAKPSRDACSLVCKRWLRLERVSRSTIRIGASGSPEHFVKLITRRFVNVRTVHVDERLSLPAQLVSLKFPKLNPNLDSLGHKLFLITSNY